MTKLNERLSPWYDFPQSDGEYGLEIETETKRESDYPEDFIKHAINPMGHKFMEFPSLKHWVGHYDNSLRNYGVEFVFKEPLKFKQALAALDDWKTKTSSVKFIQNAPSTSVHVHWNVFNESFMTIANFLAVYSLYENLLTAYSGPLRRSNLFALPIRVCEMVSDNMVKMLKGLDQGNSAAVMFNDANTKYAALNVSSLQKLGSLEIRCFRGTTDAEEIKKWLSIINQMVIFSRTSTNPQEMLDLFEKEPEELFLLTFGPYDTMVKEAAGDDFDLLVNKNLWYLKQVAEAIPDWSKFESCMDETHSAFIKMTKARKIPKKSATNVSQLGQQYIEMHDMALVSPGGITWQDLTVPTIPAPIDAHLATISPVVMESIPVEDQFWQQFEEDQVDTDNEGGIW